MQKVEFHPEVFLEVDEARSWYDKRGAELGRRLLLEIDSAISDIAEHPLRWPLYDGDARRTILRKFPYSVVYVPFNDLVYIVALAHFSRMPGYWKHRLSEM